MATVIAGAARRMHLSAPYSKNRSKKSLTTRIVTSRWKHGVFDIIKNAVEGAVILDLFCGVGSLGIEALSRGAEGCDFVETSKEALHYLEKNLERTRLTHKAMIFKIPVEEFLAQGHECDELYRVIFMDPPYKDISTEKIFSFLEQCMPLACDKAVIIVKHPIYIEVPKQIENENGFLTLDVQKKYSISMASVYFFEKKAESTNEAPLTR